MHKMDDRALGAGILIGSVIGIIVYFWLVFLSPWHILIVQASAFIAVAAVLAIIAWIGYTLATTPPPEPLESYAEAFDEETSEEETETEESAA